MSIESTGRRLQAILIVLALVGPAAFPAVQAGMVALDKAQPVDVIHTSDTDPRYAADQLEQFADDAKLNLRFQEVRDPSDLREAIARSDAAMTIVVGHGATTRVGPESGILVGDGRLPREAVVDAVEESSAERFFFAVCGLGMPESVDGRPVTSFDGNVDVRVATVGALSDLGQIYQHETAADTLDAFQRTIERLGGRQELTARMVMPQDPLHPPRYHGSDDPYCYNPSHSRYCDWSESDEDQGIKRANEEGGAWGDVEFLGVDLDVLIDQGNVEVWFDTTRSMGNHEEEDFRWLVALKFEDCKTIVSLKDLVVPGVSKAIDGLDEALDYVNTDVEASLAKVDLCGNAWAGQVIHDGRAEPIAGGDVEVQVGTDITVQIDWGPFEEDWTVWAGLIGEIGLTIDDTRNRGARLGLYASLSFTMKGNFGYIEGQVHVEAIRWSRSVHLDRNDAQQSQSVSIGGGVAVPPSHPAVTETTTRDGVPIRVIDVSQTRTLTPANVRLIESDEDLARRLAEATGSDPATFEAGDILDLGDEDVCRALQGDLYPCPTTLTDLPDPGRSTGSDDDGASSAGDRCREEETPNPTEPLPFVEPLSAPKARARACVDADDSSVQAHAQIGPSDLVGDLQEGNREEIFDSASPVHACRKANMQPQTCRQVGVAAGVLGLATSRQSTGANAHVWVDPTASEAGQVVRFCATGTGCPRMTAGVTDPEGNLGEIDLSISSSSSLDIDMTLKDAPAAAEDRAVLLVNEAGLRTDMIVCDGVRWYEGLDQQQEEDPCS